MSDLDIGMNDWMCPDLKWDDSYVPDRGKVYNKEEIAKLEKFHRYLDVDGDGIPYRTLPGVHPKGAYFTRGSGHTQYGVYTEDSAEYQIVLDRLTRKFATAKRLVPKPVIEQDAHIDIAVVAYGSSDGAVREALAILAEHGIKTNYMRLRSFPFGDEVEKFLEQQKLVFVIEQNRDAQMRSLLTLETRVEKAKLRSLLHYSGLPISSEFIVKGVLAEVEPKTRKLEAVSTTGVA
jgi:2-oxoglutarate ferredoxin oxidoreductase subunit alpha